MKDIIAHYHEIGLKGKNRSNFENQLVRNIKVALSQDQLKEVRRLSGRILISLKKSFDEEIKNSIRRVFGISSFAPAAIIKPELEEIKKKAIELILAQKPESFVVRTKRSDKQFPGTSEEVNREVGAAVLEAVGGKVNLHSPELTVFIEILAKEAYVMTAKYDGPGGLPVGVSGRVVAMLSGGIDSPVAAWKVMKRGCEVVFVHFHSYPHTSRASITKVKELAKLVGAYQQKSVLYLVPLSEAQRQIVISCEPKYRVLLYRRLMIRVANEIAKREHATAIVTGESIGQVASQTLPNLQVTENASKLPIFRPLIGDDKEEIIVQAKKINTYDLSIQPHEDCCTLFVPANPATKSRISDLEKEEKKLEIEKLISEMILKTEKEII